MILEVCVDSLQSALIAQKAGADRIELCSALELGGLSPSPGLLRRVRDALSIDVNVLIRPRAGDFCYTEAEQETMLGDICFAKSCGVNGIVSGALNPDGELDLNTLFRLIKASGDLSFTFHRAFDYCCDQYKMLEMLAISSVDRILTSGGQSSAMQGAGRLLHLQSEVAGRIIILAGGGINSQNAKAIANISGVQELHFSATEYVESPMRHCAADFSLSANGNLGDRIRRANYDEIRKIRELFD